MSVPLVTIGLTTFNAEKTAERALRSAREQNWGAVEIIIVDDASTDATVSRLSAVAAGLRNVRILINEKNSGVAISRNRIIQEAKGEFIAFFDDDDESHPERVALQLDRITTYEKAFAAGAPVVCHAAREQIYPDGSRRIERTMGESFHERAPAGVAVALRILAGAPLANGYGSCATCSQMSRTSTYRAVGGFDPLFRRSQDTEFCVRVARAGGHFVGIAKPLVVQTMTKTFDKSIAREMKYHLALVDKHKDIFDDERAYTFSREWIETKHSWLENNRRAFFARLLRLSVQHPVRVVQRLRTAVLFWGSNHAFRRFHRSMAD